MLWSNLSPPSKFDVPMISCFRMGAQGSKVNFRQAVIDLTSKPGKQDDDSFWEQLWSPDSVHSVNDVFAMIPADDVRKLREDSPKNLATLCYKTLEKLQYARDHPNNLSERKVAFEIDSII
ncbi:hypothetical protein NECAME_08131, partial [Necator americanus]